jgi:hypothetical protein
MLSDPGARVGKRFIASVKTASQRRVDADRLRRDYPATAEAVTDKITVQTVYLSGISEDGEIIPLLRGPHKGSLQTQVQPKEKTRMTDHALCQDCLRLHLVCDLIPDGNDPPGLCPVCRGQCCDCTACMSEAAALLRGDDKTAARNLQPQFRHRLLRWSASEGATFR